MPPARARRPIKPPKTGVTQEAQEALAAQGIQVPAESLSAEGEPRIDDTQEIPVFREDVASESWFLDANQTPEFSYPEFDSVGLPREVPSSPEGVGNLDGGIPTGNAGRAIDRELEKEKPLLDPEKPRRAVDSGIPDKDEWLDFFSRIVLKVGLELYTDFAFRGIDSDVVSDADLRRIKVSKEERDIIARPFAEYSTKNKFLRKHGREIVAFADSLESLVTLGIWMRKVNRIAAKYRPKKENRKQNIRLKPERGFSHEHAGQNAGPGANGTEPGPDVIIPTIFNPGSG
jgi:hypothetical protein